jgi:hypothetical protein
MVGDRPVNLIGFQDKYKYTPMCTPEGLTPLFCTNGTQKAKCDPYFEQVLRNPDLVVGERRALTGFSSGVWRDNLWSKYRTAGDILTKGNADEEPAASPGSFWVFEDTTTSFMVLIGVYFPSVTGEIFGYLNLIPILGIMAGSNRSGNLRDVSRAIPLGTIAAQLITSVTCNNIESDSNNLTF